jgi:hypothetical protein
VIRRNRVARLDRGAPALAPAERRPEHGGGDPPRDVDKVLDHTATFAWPFADHLPGEFLLQAGPDEQRRQRVELDAVLRCKDADRIRRLAADATEARVERAPHRAHGRRRRVGPGGAPEPAPSSSSR